MSKDNIVGFSLSENLSQEELVQKFFEVTRGVKVSIVKEAIKSFEVSLEHWSVVNWEDKA